MTDNFEDMEYVDSSSEKEYLSAFVIPKVKDLGMRSMLWLSI